MNHFQHKYHLLTFLQVRKIAQTKEFKHISHLTLHNTGFGIRKIFSSEKFDENGRNLRPFVFTLRKESFGQGWGPSVALPPSREGSMWLQLYIIRDLIYGFFSAVSFVANMERFCKVVWTMICRIQWLPRLKIRWIL